MICELTRIGNEDVQGVWNAETTGASSKRGAFRPPRRTEVLEKPHEKNLDGILKERETISALKNQSVLLPFREGPFNHKAQGSSEDRPTLGFVVKRFQRTRIRKLSPRKADDIEIRPLRPMAWAIRIAGQLGPKKNAGLSCNLLCSARVSKTLQIRNVPIFSGCLSGRSISKADGRISKETTTTLKPIRGFSKGFDDFVGNVNFPLNGTDLLSGQFQLRFDQGHKA